MEDFLNIKIFFRFPVHVDIKDRFTCVLCLLIKLIAKTFKCRNSIFQIENNFKFQCYALDRVNNGLCQWEKKDLVNIAKINIQYKTNFYKLNIIPFLSSIQIFFATFNFKIFNNF